VPLKFLVLEDNIDFSECIVETLLSRNCVVSSTASVDEAIQFFDQQHFDAVITDLHLVHFRSSKSSGLDLVQHIRSKQKSQVVIAMTTGLELVKPEEIKAHGVDIFYYKPISIGLEGFIDLIFELCEKRAQI
jgi:CheY-like chemotaxis protein